MAHDLHIENGKASMFYVKEEPWHGLGTRLDRPATAEEAIIAANLDWQVVKEPVYAYYGNKEYRVTNRFAVLRKDKIGTPDCVPFGFVGKSYTPLQNRESFQFFDDIVGAGEAIYHTAGALGHGERVWILAKLPSQIRVVGDDLTDKYLLMSNSHDGQSTVQIKFTPIRVVCTNTLSMALEDGRSIKVPHARDLHQRLKNAQEALGLIKKRYDEIEEIFKNLVKVQMANGRMANYFQAVFPDPENEADEKGHKRAQQHREWSEYFAWNGAGNVMNGVTGTLWAAFNGVTEYIDHCKPLKFRRSNERRLHSIWFGDGYRAKARAFRVAEQKLGEWAH
jgi:phage/plasmid-like protein (TIGR03299 family)